MPAPTCLVLDARPVRSQHDLKVRPREPDALTRTVTMQTAKRNLASITQVPPGRFDFRLETTDIDVAPGEGAQGPGTGQFGSICSMSETGRGN